MIFFKFILCFLLAEAIIVTIRFIASKSIIKPWFKSTIIILEFLVSFLLAYLLMALGFDFWFGPFLFALYVALLMDGFAQLIYLIVRLFVNKKKRFIILTIISNVLGVAFLTFGMVNMEVVSAKYLSYISDKLNNTYKIAFVSDMHVGEAQPLHVTLNTIESIKKHNPDFTIIGGDLVDEHTTMDDMKETVKAFASFTTPVYFIRGNHDLLGKITIKDLEDELINSGINVVIDEFIKLGDDLTLLGREDLSNEERKKITDLVNPYPGSYLLVADHQPFDFKENAKIGLDLQLSGHTHAGQIFPLRLFYSFAVYTYGEYHYENATLNVSAGASGWQVPLRTEVGSQYEIITLQPNH